MRCACERSRAYARAYTPVVLFFCCHICHSRNILGGEELAYREANVLFFEVIRSCLTHIQQFQYVKSHRKTNNHLIFLLLQIICDRCDSKKHKTLVQTRVRMRARGDSTVIFTFFQLLKNVGFHPSFSRHGITRASSVLLIWLNENVPPRCFGDNLHTPRR